MKRFRPILHLTVTLVTALGLAAAQPAPPAASHAPETDKSKAKPPLPIENRTIQSQHSIRLNGKELKYTAAASTLVLKKEDGTPRASIFSVAYTLDGEQDMARRPITFCFNGGPGSSSVWLHLGALGPRRVYFHPDGTPTPPPYHLVDNDQTILDKTDLVFIDPVSTGYSRAAQEKEAKEFHGFKGDIESVGDFIRLYTTRNNRWASPKYLIGESYGTTRAAALSGYLQDAMGMNLNGIALISSILNFEGARFARGNDLPYILFLPTYAATAWYHKRLPGDLQSLGVKKVFAEAEAFAGGEYATALMKGDSLPDAQRKEIARKVARLTGLTPEYVEETNLRINIQRFCKQLLRGDRRTVGRFDSRYTGIDYDAAGERPDYDPSYAVVQGAYTAVLNDYMRRELKFETDLPYEILTGRVQPWSYAGFENGFVNVAETLRSAMTQNPALRVYVAKGYYDLATPAYMSSYTMDHMGLAPSLRANLSDDYFEAGHMMYLTAESLAKLKKDLAAFLR